MSNLLNHNSLFFRFLSLFGLGLALFLAAWIFSFHFLPEGVIQGRTAAAALAGSEASDNFLSEFLKIFTLNTFMIFIIIAANRILVIGKFPLGYLPPLLLAAMYAITLGTNSFSIPLPERMVPSLDVLGRSGPYEIIAYMLIAVSTYNLPTSKFKRLIPPDSEPITPTPPFFKNINWLGVVLAIALLISANMWEAYQIISLA